MSELCEALGSLLLTGGRVEHCAQCKGAHVVRIAQQRNGSLVLSETAVDAAIASVQAQLDGRRPPECACSCCVGVRTENAWLVEYACQSL